MHRAELANFSYHAGSAGLLKALVPWGEMFHKRGPLLALATTSAAFRVDCL